MSSVGVVTLTRRYWQCPCGAEAGSYAADRLLGIDGRFSRTVQKHACRLSADVSFAATREHLRELLGVSVCAETIRTLVEGHGKAMARFQPVDEATAEAFRKAPGDVEFAVDAGKVNTREESWKDLKIAVISKRESGVGVSPAGWEDQRLPAATMVLAFAMIAAAKTFRRSWRSRLRRLGVTSFATVHALGDGAGWIWKSVGRSLTGCVETLDLFHACEHLAKAAAGDAVELERRRVVTERLIGYFSKHTKRLNYAGRLASGRAIGSGAVEGWAKTLGLRLKARGARWNKANVQPMASLVCVRHSPQWDAYWSTAA